MGKKYGTLPAHQQAIINALRDAGFKVAPRGERIPLPHEGNGPAFQKIARQLNRELPPRLGQEHADAVASFLEPHLPHTHDVSFQLKKTGTVGHEKPVEVRIEFKKRA